jgi:hypothetical protein
VVVDIGEIGFNDVFTHMLTWQLKISNILALRIAFLSNDWVRPMNLLPYQQIL